MSPLALFLSLSLSLAVLVGANNGHLSNQALARKSHVGRSTSEKRSFPGHATYFADGLGACGHYNGPNDYIVALNSPQYGNGEDCGKQILIEGLGTSAIATIADECPGCPYGCLDFSEGLFKHFAALSVGEFQITWSFTDGSGAKPTSKKPPPPATTTHHTTTTTTTSSTTSTTSSTSSAPSSSSTSDSGTDDTTTSTTGGNLVNTGKLIYNFGSIVTFAANAATS